MKKTVLNILLLCASLGLWAQDGKEAQPFLTLRECIETATANNLSVKRSDYAAQSSSVDVLQAKGQFLPSVSGVVYHGSNQGRNINPYTNTYINQSVNFANYGLDGSITLFNGLSNQNALRQYQLLLEAGKMDAQQQRDVVTINVILAYLSVLSSRDQLTLAEQQTEVSRKQVERLQILNEEGAISPSDYYDLKGQLATNELSIVTAKNALQTAKLTLAQLMNVPYQENVVLQPLADEPAPAAYEAQPDDIYAVAVEKLAIVKAAEYRHLSALKAVKAARGLSLPRISLNGGLGTNYSSTGTIQQFVSSTDVAGDNYVIINDVKMPVYAPVAQFTSSKIPYAEQWKNNFNSYINIALSIPLLNGLQTRSRIKQAKIAEDRTSYEEAATKLQLKQNIEQAHLNSTTAYLRYKTLERQVEDFDASFAAAQIKFEAGVFTSVDFLVVKNNLDSARINLVNAKYDYLLRSKILDYYQTKPLW